MSNKQHKSSKKFGVYAKKQLAYFNSLQVESRILIVLGGILAVPVIMYVCLFALGIIQIGLAFNEDSSRKNEAEAAWHSLQLPSSLEYRNSSSYGDVIDSPDSYGWTYNYRHATSDTDEKIYKELQQTLKNAGYTITETTDPTLTPALDDTDYAITAVKPAKHTTIQVTVYDQKFVYAEVRTK